MTSTLGTYVLEVTDNGNSCSTIDEVIITQNVQEPLAEIIQIGASAIDCDNPFVLLDGSNSTPVGSLSYSWSLQNNPTTILGTDSDLEVDIPGIYILTITNTENGCSDEIFHEVLQNVDTPEPLISDPEMLTCLEDSLQLSVQELANITDLDVLWTTSVLNGILSDPSALTINIGQPGWYEVTLLNSLNGCDATTMMEVISNDVYPTADGSALDELDCVTEEVALSGEGTSTGSNFSYLWTGPQIISGSTSLSPVVGEAGAYQLQVTDNANGCVTYAPVEVEENTNVPVGLTAEILPPICYGDPGTAEVMLVEGGEGPYQYAIGSTGTYQDSPRFTNLSPVSYQVNIIDATGCTYEETITVPFTSPIQVLLDAEIEINLGENSQLTTTLSFQESELGSISWTPVESLFCADCIDPIASPLETTIYQVVVTDENGCPAQDDILVRVRKDYAVYIPNAFSPNNDGDNDGFMIFSSEIGVEEVEEFIIANRWGEIVHSDYNFQPNDPAHSWDGTMSGDPLNPAVFVFVYYARIRFINGKTVDFKEDVSLIR